MKFPPMEELHTARLVLRKFRHADWEDHHLHITGDGEVAKHMLWNANPDPAHARAVVERIISCYGTRDGYRWAITRREDGAYMGSISLLRMEEAREGCAFAYMLGRAFWGRGYMTEALGAVFAFAFEKMELAWIQADHFADNPASGAVMRKVGMEQAGYLPAHYEKDGCFHDAVVYRITREMWRK